MVFSTAYSAPVGAEDAALAAKGWAHISDAALSDDDFSNGDAATAEIDLGDTPPNFFKAKVEER